MDLLARRPDAVFDQPGKLEPGRDEGMPTVSWGAAEGVGWDKRAFELPDGTLYKRNNQPAAQLILRATRPTKRRLQMTVWSADPAGEQPGPLEVHLNGRIVAAVQLTKEPKLHEFELPAPLWGFGENLLELIALETSQSDTRRWDIFAVSRIEYGPRRELQLDFETRKAELAVDTGLRYLVDVVPESRLIIATHPTASGRLEVRFGGMNPSDGRRSFEGYPAMEFPVPVTGLEVQRPFPETAEEIQVVELIWTSENNGVLSLERLEVFEKRSDARPPIIFISIDTFAARHLAVYGYHRQNTPALNRLAAEGVVFEHCISNAPWTMPSYLSVLTGLYPRSHVADLTFAPDVQLDNWDWWQIAENRWTIAEAMRARGYETAGLADTHWLSEKFRVNQGFDRYDISAAFLPIQETGGGIAYQLEQLIRPWLDFRNQALPPFLFLHALDAHGPYLPEEAFRDRFVSSLPEDQRLTPAGSSYQTYGAIPVWMARTAVPDPEMDIPSELPLEPIIQRYDESILKVDTYLGRLFELLNEHGLYDDAVIVVTGDHGESFDHGFYSHGGLWEDVIHVPLLLKLPGGEHSGRRIATSVQLVDVYPTLFELAGAGKPPAFLHGRSLMPILRGEDPSALPVFCEGGHVEQYTVLDQGWKLIEVFPGKESGEASLLSHPRVPRAWLRDNFPQLVDAPLTDALREELRGQPGYADKVLELRSLIGGPYYRLYNLNVDPHEKNDLSEREKDRLEWLLALLARHKQMGLEAQKNADPEIFTATFSADVLKHLAELGYADVPEETDDTEAD